MRRIQRLCEYPNFSCVFKIILRCILSFLPAFISGVMRGKSHLSPVDSLLTFTALTSSTIYSHSESPQQPFLKQMEPYHRYICFNMYFHSSKMENNFIIKMPVILDWNIFLVISYLPVARSPLHLLKKSETHHRLFHRSTCRVCLVYY